MSLRVSRKSGSLLDDEDAVMGDISQAQTWNAASTVVNAGLWFSSWLFCQPPHTHSQLAVPSDKQRYFDQRQSRPSSNMDIDNCVKASVHINTLPSELLGEIFVHYTHPSDECNADCTDRRFQTKRHAFRGVAASRDPATKPIILGQVCGLWRALSLSMPILWSTISVISPRPCDIAIFCIWLERSANYPLHLSISQRLPNTLNPTCAIRDIFLLAAVHQHRWRTIYLELFSDLYDTISDTVHDLPELERCGLELFKWPVSGQMKVRDLMLSSSPNLSHLRLGHSFSNPVIEANAHWSTLTSLDVQCLDVAGLFSIFSVCISLRSLSVLALEGSQREGFSPASLHLPQLEILALDCLHDSTTIFDHIRFPRLRKLELSQGFGFMCPPEEGWRSLSAALMASVCQLRELTIFVDDHEEVLVDVLRSPAMVGLQHLTVKSPITDKGLETMTIGPDTRAIPQLQTVSLWNCTSSDGALANLIRSRIEWGSPLKAAHAVLYGPSHLLDLSLRADGILLHVFRYQ